MPKSIKWFFIVYEVLSSLTAFYRISTTNMFSRASVLIALLAILACLTVSVTGKGSSTSDSASKTDEAASSHSLPSITQSRADTTPLKDGLVFLSLQGEGKTM